jgi:Zn ribbon nucleic-acid-binding protein
MRSSLAPAWQDYRTRRRLFAAILAASVPILAWTRASPATGDAWKDALLAAWITLSLGAAGWFASFRCPFCGEHFDWTLWVLNPFSGECLHCGFRRWRDPHAARTFFARR